MKRFYWKQCPSVTTGGKKFFYYSQFNGHSYHVVYCRADGLFHAQQDHHTLSRFKDLGDALCYLETVA